MDNNGLKTPTTCGRKMLLTPTNFSFFLHFFFYEKHAYKVVPHNCVCWLLKPIKYSDIPYKQLQHLQYIKHSENEVLGTNLAIIN